MKIPSLPTYEEWRKSETLSGEAARVLSDEHCQMMLAILQHNGRTLSVPFGASEVDVIRSAGYREGYEACLASFLSFSAYIPPVEDLKEEFKDETRGNQDSLWQQTQQ